VQGDFRDVEFVELRPSLVEGKYLDIGLLVEEYDLAPLPSKLSE
jgi:hypothetical protein